MSSAPDKNLNIESQTLDFVRVAFKCVIFLTIGGILWWSANDFSVAEPKGFDPLRYEYYAQVGLPQAFQDTSSYRLVLLLDYLYRYLPSYYGYLLFVGILIFFVCRIDDKRIISAALFSSIAFYYVPQTGKDGIAIICMVSVALIATQVNNLVKIVVVGVICTLAIYIRPAIIIFIPLIILQFRYGTFYSILICPFILYLFSTNTDSYSILLNLESLTSDEGAGAVASFLRQYTFGYDLEAVAYKMFLLLISLFFQPLIGFYKFYSGSPKFVILEGTAFLVFLITVVRERLLLKFLISSIPYVIVVGYTSPFYHFRYLAVSYPVILAFCRYAPGIGWAGVARSRIMSESASAVAGQFWRRQIRVS